MNIKIYVCNSKMYNQNTKFYFSIKIFSEFKFSFNAKYIRLLKNGGQALARNQKF